MSGGRERPRRAARGSTAGPTWRHAAWILALALLLSGAVVAWRLSAVLGGRGGRAVGDGRDPATYGFVLEPCLVPRESLTGGGLPRDGVPVLDHPRLMYASAVDSLNRAQRGKYLVSSDRVIGLEIGGRARAYPVRVLCWHEVVNDTLGGILIAVSYNPLCDSAAAFHRVVPPPPGAGSGGADTVRFGVSGLLLNSNQLLYDRRPPGREASLWSQLLGRAIAGPAAAAGRALAPLPLEIVRWDDWRARHPDTDVLLPAEAMRERYKRSPYGHYYGDDLLRFPAAPLPAGPTAASGPGAGLALKDPVLAVTAGGRRVVYPLRAIARRAAPDTAGPASAGGVWTTRQGEAELVFHHRSDPPTARVRPVRPDASFTVVQSFWFAWHSHHPADELLWP